MVYIQLQTVSHPSSNHLIATRLGVELMMILWSSVQRIIQLFTTTASTDTDDDTITITNTSTNNG